MQEKQLVQQQALEQAQQNEQLRAQVRPLMLRCTSAPTTNVFLALLHHLWIHPLCLCAECCAWSQSNVTSDGVAPFPIPSAPAAPSNCLPCPVCRCLVCLSAVARSRASGRS